MLHQKPIRNATFQQKHHALSEFYLFYSDKVQYCWITCLFQPNIPYGFFSFALIKGSVTMMFDVENDDDLMVLVELNSIFTQLGTLIMEIPPQGMVPWLHPPNRYRTFDQLHPMPVKKLLTVSEKKA
jgi:hypothetical protein